MSDKLLEAQDVMTEAVAYTRHELKSYRVALEQCVEALEKLNGWIDPEGLCREDLNDIADAALASARMRLG